MKTLREWRFNSTHS